MPEKAPNLKKTQGTKKQHATILTSTPIKDVLVEKDNKKKSKAEKSKGKEVVKKSKPQKDRVKKVKKKILQESNDSSTSDVNMDELCQDDEDDDAEGSNICLVCGEFGRDNEVSFQQTFEQKRSAHLAELQQKEDEMRQMFVQRVKEKEAELKEAEKELHSKFDKLKKDHTDEKKRLEELRKKIEDDTIEFNRRKQQSAQAHHTLTLGKSKKK